MKLDLSKPHGLIFGHGSATYEQNGVLFNGAGEPLSDGPEMVEIIETALGDVQVENAKEFLISLLSKGPMGKSVVFKESGDHNQRWETVKIAFSQLKGEVSKAKNAEVWSLNADRMKP